MSTVLFSAFVHCACSHYFAHGCFFSERWPTENPLLDQVHKIADIPGAIIQGHYDMICPMRTAYELHQVSPPIVLIMLFEDTFFCLRDEEKSINILKLGSLASVKESYRKQNIRAVSRGEGGVGVRCTLSRFD